VTGNWQGTAANALALHDTDQLASLDITENLLATARPAHGESIDACQVTQTKVEPRPMLRGITATSSDMPHLLRQVRPSPAVAWRNFHGYDRADSIAVGLDAFQLHCQPTPPRSQVVAQQGGGDCFLAGVARVVVDDHVKGPIVIEVGDRQSAAILDVVGPDRHAHIREVEISGSVYTFVSQQNLGFKTIP
jgi:hypothetical protein